MASGATKPDHVEVKDIQFAYNNHEVIAILKTRGTAIAACKWDKVKELDKALTEMVKDKNNYRKLSTPVCAIITFESDDGANEALLYSKQRHWYNIGEDKDYKGFQKTEILDSPPHFTEATEPTNI